MKKEDKEAHQRREKEKARQKDKLYFKYDSLKVPYRKVPSIKRIQSLQPIKIN